eukprot:g12224.t1
MPESRKAKTDSDVVMAGGDEHEPASSSAVMKMPAYVQTQEEDEIPLVCVISQKRIASFVVKTLPSGLSKKFTSLEDVFMWDVENKEMRDLFDGTAAAATGVLTRCILRAMVEDPMSELHDEFEGRLIVSNIEEADGLFLSGLPEDSGQYFQEMRAANKTKTKAVKKNPSSRKTKLEKIPLEKKSEKLQGLYERIAAKSERRK